MIELFIAEAFRWINPHTGGYETGRIVANERGQYITEYGGCDTQPIQPQVRVLVAGSFGGLYFVAMESLERMPMRSEWEPASISSSSSIRSMS